MSNDYKSFVERHGKNFCALPFTEIANTAQGHTMLCCYSETIDSNVIFHFTVSLFLSE